MVDEKKPEKEKQPFRFLTHAEFAALTQEERIRYLDEAVRHVKLGSPSGKLFKED